MSGSGVSTAEARDGAEGATRGGGGGSLRMRLRDIGGGETGGEEVRARKGGDEGTSGWTTEEGVGDDF